MDRLKELFAQAAALTAKMDALDKTRDASADKKFTAEQGAAYKAAVTELESVNDSIDTEQRATKVRARTAEPQPAPVSLEIHNVASEAPYAFGEMLRDVRAATMGGQRSARLDMHQKRAFRMATGANEGLPSEGGFLVGTDFATAILKRMYENSAVVSRVARMPIGATSNGLKINGVDETSRATGSRFGGITGYWVAEGATISGSKPKFRQLEWILKKLAALYYATDELLADGVAFSAVAEQAVSEEIAFMLQDSLVNGNGAGKPLGFLAAPCLVTVTKETGQAADTLVKANIDKMWSRAWAPGRLNSVWLINQEIEPQLAALEAPAGTGGIPAYMPPGGLADAPYGSIKGRPVIAIEQAAALGDAGDISLVDLSQYLVVDKGGVQAASSIHVQFLTDEQVFRFIYRVDGHPLWTAPLTPFKGAAANTLSPFVTLGARA